MAEVDPKDLSGGTEAVAAVVVQVIEVEALEANAVVSPKATTIVGARAPHDGAKAALVGTRATWQRASDRTAGCTMCLRPGHLRVLHRGRPQWLQRWIRSLRH